MKTEEIKWAIFYEHNGKECNTLYDTRKIARKYKSDEDKIVKVKVTIEEVESKPNKEVTYSIGQRFLIDEHEYILGSTASCSLALIDLDTGYRWGDAFAADDIFHVSSTELDFQICEAWELLPKK